MALLVEHDGKKKKKKKKKKKASMLVRVIGKIMLGQAAALGQIGDAIREATDKYRRKHEKSRKRRRDGWKRDFGSNLASATTELMQGTAKAPSKFANQLWKKNKKKKKHRKADRDERTTLAPPSSNVAQQPREP